VSPFSRPLGCSPSLSQTSVLFLSIHIKMPLADPGHFSHSSAFSPLRTRRLLCACTSCISFIPFDQATVGLLSEASRVPFALVTRFPFVPFLLCPAPSSTGDMVVVVTYLFRRSPIGLLREIGSSSLHFSFLDFDQAYFTFWVRLLDLPFTAPTSGVSGGGLPPLLLPRHQHPALLLL